jgi:alginate O-acetyltransferase complex protein AlgJ
MTTIPRPPREEQALREVGRTEVSRTIALSTGLLLLASVAAIPFLRAVGVGLAAPEERWAPFAGLGAALAEAREIAPEEGALAANRRVLRGLHDFEDALEETAPLAEPVQRWGQWALTRFGGVGNERALVGRGGRLHYAPDIAVVSGPGFLEAEALTRRSRSGESWERAPEPDPRPALRALDRWLEGRGVRLLILPVPSKAAIEPEGYSRRFADASPPLANPSWERWTGWLGAEGIEWLDLRPVLEAAADGADAFLERDSHWTPAAMEEAALALAARLEPWLGPVEEDAPVLLRREAVVEGRGDLAVMLRLPEGREPWPLQRVTGRPVTDDLGRRWRPMHGAAVLLLGDSFTNVFADEGLGWGSGAGLAEQLAYRLQRPVDRIAQNAGGAWAARQALRRELRSDPARLDGARVVVYQFAERELAFGDWREVEWPQRLGR